MNKLKIRQKMLEQDYEAKKNQIEEKSDNILEFEIPNEVLIKMIIYFFLKWIENVLNLRLYCRFSWILVSNFKLKNNLIFTITH